MTLKLFLQTIHSNWWLLFGNQGGVFESEKSKLMRSLITMIFPQRAAAGGPLHHQTYMHPNNSCTFESLIRSGGGQLGDARHSCPERIDIICSKSAPFFAQFKQQTYPSINVISPLRLHYYYFAHMWVNKEGGKFLCSNSTWPSLIEKTWPSWTWFKFITALTPAHYHCGCDSRPCFYHNSPSLLSLMIDRTENGNYHPTTWASPKVLITRAHQQPWYA